MKIAALRLYNVKRFAGRGVAIEGIGDGVNVLCAANEFGKSTSFEALHALFFLSHTGTSGDIRNLRPYSGGNPVVEADIATGEGRFRVRKQFYGGRSARVLDIASGRLVAQADEAENFIAGLVTGGTAGPAGLLWVRQGITGIERRSRSEEDSEKQVRASLLESVQGEVEAVTGGRRMAGIMAATEAALARLVTATGRPKAGERYAAAIEERDRLVAEERRLGLEVEALREALDRRATAAGRLAELDRAEDRDERRKAIEAAQAAFDAAKAQGEALRAAEAELKLVSTRRDAAARELETFEAALGQAKVVEERKAEAERRRAEAVERRRLTAEAIDRAAAEAEAAETAEQEARALLARLDAAMRAREQAQRLADLEKRLAAADDARKAIEDGQAQLALHELPQKSVAELEALDVEIAKLRAVEEATRPLVAVAYETAAAPRIAMDGVALEEGEPRAYDGQARLVVPGIGVVTLRSNQPARSDDRRARAEDRRRALLEAMGVDDLAAARRRQVEAQRVEGALREAKARLSLLAPEGLAKLREEVASHRAAEVGELELKEDPVLARRASTEAETRRVSARQALREIAGTRAGADEAFVAAETAVAAIAGERARVEAILGAEDARAARHHQLSLELAELDDRHAEARDAVDRLRAASKDVVSAEAALKRALSVAEATDKEIGSLRETVAGLNAEIRTRADEAVEEKWREAGEALSATTARVAAFAKEVAVLQRLLGALQTARGHARDLYLKPVMTELRPLLEMLFDEVSISFDEKTLLPQTIIRNGQEEDVERLSGGMREQLSVLTRLAFARLLARDGRPAPVILDDALVYSDDDRIEKMFDALHRQSRDQQIIVFSCRQRAFQKLGGNVLRMVDWVPEG